MATRTYKAPPHSERCKYDIRLRGDGKTEGARCMRRAVLFGYWKQHAKMLPRA